jgi:hypothetical protein
VADNSSQSESPRVLLATFVAVRVLQWPLVPVVLVLTPLSVIWAWWTRADAE